MHANKLRVIYSKRGLHIFAKNILTLRSNNLKSYLSHCF